MRLTDIYKRKAAYVRASGFTVDVDEMRGTVSIEDSTGERAIFLQDEEGYSWIDKARHVWNACGDLGLDDCFYGHAEDYVDSLD